MPSARLAARRSRRPTRSTSAPAPMLRQALGFTLLASLCGLSAAGDLHLNDLDYFETQGLSVLAYQNSFHPVFRDQKLGGIEIILHGERIATDGEVRLEPTPEQWDPVPTLASRK